MRLKQLTFFIATLFYCLSASAIYYTPNTGVRYSLSDLVANSAGDVTYVAGEYFVNANIYISANDTLEIITDEIVQYASGVILDVNGILLIDPPTQVVFTAQNTVSGFLGLRLDSTNSSIIRNFTFEYASALRIQDCSPVIDSCLFQYNTISTTLGTAAISLVRGKPIISNSSFINNKYAAIQGASNVPNAPVITDNLFQTNNTSGFGAVQISLGASGNDTVKIIGNKIIDNTNGGGVGFLPSTFPLNAFINGNLIKNNRSGIIMQGSSSSLINAVISYNQIDSNTSVNNPTYFGSGIAFSGSTAANPQNTIVTGNIFRGNLWGVTIQGRAKPNLGNLTNIDTTDDGKNEFYGNTNTSTPDIDLYNNTIDPIFAQNNYWNTSSVLTAEDKIYHQADDVTKGLVNFQPIMNIPLPLQLISFSANKIDDIIKLKWTTASEKNIRHFVLEKSYDGKVFSSLTTIASKQSGGRNDYDYNDTQENKNDIYYRLKIVDNNEETGYSQVVKTADAIASNAINVYPTMINANENIYVSIESEKDQEVIVELYNVSGRLIARDRRSIIKGANRFDLSALDIDDKGYVYIRVSLQNEMITVPVYIQ